MCSLTTRSQSTTCCTRLASPRCSVRCTANILSSPTPIQLLGHNQRSRVGSTRRDESHIIVTLIYLPMTVVSARSHVVCPFQTSSFVGARGEDSRPSIAPVFMEDTSNFTICCPTLQEGLICIPDPTEIFCSKFRRLEAPRCLIISHLPGQKRPFINKLSFVCLSTRLSDFRTAKELQKKLHLTVRRGGTG